jgi:hypothetical protein
MYVYDNLCRDLSPLCFLFERKQGHAEQDQEQGKKGERSFIQVSQFPPTCRSVK